MDAIDGDASIKAAIPEGPCRPRLHPLAGVWAAMRWASCGTATAASPPNGCSREPGVGWPLVPHMDIRSVVRSTTSPVGSAVPAMTATDG
jgi:hypothetical protein